MKQIEIYQLTIEQGGIFCSLKFNQEHGFEVKAKNYNQVYACEREDDYSVEDAFVEFNCNHPEDFRGHSLSVSDVVVITDENGSIAYYINPFCSVTVPDFKEEGNS
jgi:hypothetical protein